ncbi:MAG: DUF2911 domain-containing protein [Pyrinomonadaceae bacterium]
MRNFSRVALFLIFALALTTISVSAQMRGPRPSQKAVVEQFVNDNVTLRISYGRPNAKGRQLWGAETEALVPNGKVWRAGANEATVFEVSNDVLINGKPLAAGKYSFYAIPTKDSWTLIFNKTWNQWGTNYAEKDDALRVMATPGESPKYIESMLYVFEDIKPNEATVILAWGNMRVPFTVSVPMVKTEPMEKQ